MTPAWWESPTMGISAEIDMVDFRKFEVTSGLAGGL
jgi:hypothetical protein